MPNFFVFLKSLIIIVGPTFRARVPNPSDAAVRVFDMKVEKGLENGREDGMMMSSSFDAENNATVGWPIA